MATFDMFSRLTASGALPDATIDVIDEVLVSELAWRESVTIVDTAYRNWCSAPIRDRGLSFACYVAALDQEDAAAPALTGFTLQLEIAGT
jgi:hypothetical protein